MSDPLPQLPSAVVEQVASRLGKISSLRLPSQMTKSGEVVSLEKRIDYCRKLLTHDPGVFLERHSSLLICSELAHFETLRSADYEVDFYLKILENGTSNGSRSATENQAAATQGADKLSRQVKNRRYAALQRLVAEGEHFTDKAMRSREPALHHLYIGQYRPAALSPTAVKPGSDGSGPSLAANIMAQQEELEIHLRCKAEENQWEMQEEESDEDEDEGGGGNAHGQNKNHTQSENEPGYIEISQEERDENAAAFLDHMKDAFLKGLDSSIDYRTIDADESLDGDLVQEEDRDFEDAYFADI